MKARRKLIPALALLMVSIVLLSTASYAWFASNSTTKLAGLQLGAQSPKNMFMKDALEASGDWTTDTITVNLSTNAHALTPVDVKTVPTVASITWQTGVADEVDNYAATTKEDITLAAAATDKYFYQATAGDDFYVIKLVYNFYVIAPQEQDIYVDSIDWATATNTEDLFDSIHILFVGKSAVAEVGFGRTVTWNQTTKADSAAQLNTINLIENVANQTLDGTANAQASTDSITLYLFFCGEEANNFSNNYVDTAAANIGVTFGMRNHVEA